MTASSIRNSLQSNQPLPSSSKAARDENASQQQLRDDHRPPVARAASSDALSDRATINLIRRVLCPQTPGEKSRAAQAPLEELLPPLTSRNDVDLELYALLAILLREFVQSWYNKITPDEAFVAEVMQVIAHCTRALEQRFRKIDLESLLFDELPDLLEKHILAYRTSHQPMAQPPTQNDPRQVYHALCPLPFMCPIPVDRATHSEQLENERHYRHLLVQAVLVLLLPTEDLENPCLTALVEQIFSELIIGNLVANKVAQPWLLLELVCIGARVFEEKKATTARRNLSDTDRHGFEHGQSKKRGSWSVQSIFLLIIQLVMSLVSFVRLVVATVTASATLPLRAVYSTPTPAKGRMEVTTPLVPIVSFKFWSCIGTVGQLTSRTPWLSGCLCLLRHMMLFGPGRLAATNGPIDRYLSYHLRQLFLPEQLAPLLRTVRGVVFPNNAPGKASLFPPTTEEELRQLRRRAAAALWSLLPSTVARVYFGQDEEGPDDSSSRSVEDQGSCEEPRGIKKVEELLMVISDEYCNKHLIYGILEVVLVRLLPELSEKGVQELWQERLG